MADENLPEDEQAVGTSDPDSEEDAASENVAPPDSDGAEIAGEESDASAVDSGSDPDVADVEEEVPSGDEMLDGEVSDDQEAGNAAEDQGEVPDSDTPGEESIDDIVEKQMLAELEKMNSDDEGSDDMSFGDGSAVPGGDVAEASHVEFQQLSGGGGKSDPQNLDLLLDVNLPISIELGRTSMNIQEILALGPGSVVELDKLAGEPVDLLVNNKIVAKGEVVVIDENFGIRVTNLISPEERLKSLGE
jgi:flagellar motor switch protein FliN/FliY